MNGKNLKIYAKIEAIRIEVMGMMAANKEREINMESMAYTEKEFNDAAKEILVLVDEIPEEPKNEQD